MQTITFDELKQAVRKVADEFKSQLITAIEKNWRHDFDCTKDSLRDRFSGIRYLGIFLLDSEQMDEFIKFVRSLEEELKAINWPEKGG